METPATAPLRRLLVATDGSKGAERAVVVAAGIAKAGGADLLIMTVSTDDLNGDEARYVESLHLDEGDALEAISRQILVRAVQYARESGAKSVETTLAVGDPAEKIIEAIQLKQIDMVVVGRRGRGRLEGLILGSVSQKLASLAPCVVTIVP
jgi:nucleotide-binding universal stress UspA family protein